MVRAFLLVSAAFFAFTGYLAATPAYLTFLSTGNEAIDPSQVTLKLEELDAPVSQVLYVDTANRSPDVLAHPGGRRFYVFVYDFVFSSPESLVQARKATEAFLNKIAREDLVMIAAITPHEGLKLFCAPTTDHGKVAAGLNWMGQKEVEGMMEGPDGNLYPAIFSGNSETKLIPDSAFLENIKVYALSEKERKELKPVLLQGIADLGFLLSALDGRKHVIFFTPGADTGGLSINLPLRTKAPKKGQIKEEAREEPREDLDSIMDSTMSQERMRRMASAGPGSKLQKQSGETLPDLYAGADSRVHVVHGGQQVHDLFKKMAARTAGTFLSSSAELNTAIDRILASDKTFYVLKADAPTESMKDLNNVRLQVAGREVTGSPKWLIPRASENFTSLEKKAKIAESVYKNWTKPPSAFHFWADFLPDKQSSRIPYFVQIDGPFLLGHKTDLLDLEFYAFATDKQGAVLDYSYFLFSLDLTNKSLQETLKTTGVKIWNVLLSNLQPANVHWTIVNLQTNQMLNYSIPIEGIESTMTVTQPFVPAMNLKWMVWPNPTQPQTKRGIEISYPYREGKDMLFFPDFSPVLKKSVDGQVVYMRIYNMPAPGKVPEVRLALVDGGGKTNEVRTLGLLQNPTPVEPKGVGLFWRLAALPDVPPGNYQLKISTLDPTSNKEITREVRTAVQ